MLYCPKSASVSIAINKPANIAGRSKGNIFKNNLSLFVPRTCADSRIDVEILSMDVLEN